MIFYPRRWMGLTLLCVVFIHSISSISIYGTSWVDKLALLMIGAIGSLGLSIKEDGISL